MMPNGSICTTWPAVATLRPGGRAGPSARRARPVRPWEDIADDLAGALRVEAGRNPHDRSLSDLIGELSTRSDAFSVRWGRQNVRLHRTARKRLHNAVVGDIELTGDALELAGDELTLIAYTADIGSPAQDQLRLLSAWTATQEQPTGHDTAETVTRPAVT